MRDKVWGLSCREKEECLEEETKGSLKEGIMGGGQVTETQRWGNKEASR